MKLNHPVFTMPWEMLGCNTDRNGVITIRHVTCTCTLHPLVTSMYAYNVHVHTTAHSMHIYMHSKPVYNYMYMYMCACTGACMYMYMLQSFSLHIIHIDTHSVSAAPTAIDEELKHALKGVRHERPEVRPYALKALLKLLKSNQASGQWQNIHSYSVGTWRLWWCTFLYVGRHTEAMMVLYTKICEFIL